MLTRSATGVSGVSAACISDLSTVCSTILCHVIHNSEAKRSASSRALTGTLDFLHEGLASRAQQSQNLAGGAQQIQEPKISRREAAAPAGPSIPKPETLLTSTKSNTQKDSSAQYRLADPSAVQLPSFLGRHRLPVDLLEAIQELKNGRKVRFDQTIEVALRLGVAPRKGDQQVRGVVTLPHGTGKAVRICILTEGEGLALAHRLGADLVGSDDIIEKIKGGRIEFDKCLATADVMPRLSQVARVLGPRGLMPNPKVGTLVDLSTMALSFKQLKGGRVEFRADRDSNVHAGVGRASFSPQHLQDNVAAFVSAILKSRPKGVKGSGASGYILGMYMSSTMGRSLPVALPSVLNAIQQLKK